MVRMTRGAFVCLALALASTAASPARAQEEAPVPQNVISINPLGVVFQVISAEYERAVSPQVSVALAGTYWGSSQDDDEGDELDVDYTSADLKLRYYPTEVLRGFSLGALGGVSRVGGEYRDCSVEDPDCNVDGGSVTALSAGVELDWAWRMGVKEKFYMAVGLGAKRLFADDDEVDATLAYPFLRFNVGWAF